MVAPQTLRAWVFLAVQAVFVHPFRTLTRSRANRGKAGFLANYALEGLVPASAAERERQPAFMRCIGCGLCDIVCPLVGRLDVKTFRGPSLVALAYARATPDLGHVAATLQRLPADCGTCTRCVDICPRRVPLRELFVHANAKLEQVRAVRRLPGKS